MKRSLSRYGLSAFAVMFLVLDLNADTLLLRDGRRIQGQLISVRDRLVEFDEVQPFGVRRLNLDRGELLGIEFDRNDRDNSRYSPQGEQQRGRPSGLRERQVFVPANMPWIDTNIDVQSGQDVYFEPGGEVKWGPNRSAGPAGEINSPANPNRPIPNRPGASLIGRVGGTSTDYFYIGANRGSFRMRSSGRLFLGVNDDYLQDNSGAFRVVVYY
jgi:hypothetical protein